MKVIKKLMENQIIFMALNFAVIALICSPVITLAGEPSTIAYIFDFPWNNYTSFFCNIFLLLELPKINCFLENK